MALGNGTMVAIPGGEAAIERIVDGDEVLAGSRQSEALSWFSAAVTFSQRAEGHQSSMSYFWFDNATELVCTADQPLLRADGRMIRAADLIPGDRLLAPDGTTRAISTHSLGEWEGGVHAIALPGDWNGRPDGHLIAAAGVVAGDYLVEIHLWEHG